MQMKTPFEISLPAYFLIFSRNSCILLIEEILHKDFEPNILRSVICARGDF